MSYVTIEIEEKDKKQAIDLYYDFMSKEKSRALAFSSLDEFKKSDVYQELPDEEKAHYEQYEGKKVIVLMFDDAEQATRFIEQLQLKGFCSKEQAEAAINFFNEEIQSSHRPGM